MGNPLNSRWLNGSLVVYPSTIVGTTFHVDSVNGASDATGLDWDNALTTVDLAIAKCTANSGDKIVCAPWHVETSTTAADVFTMDKAGIDLIGLRQGIQRPTFTLGHADTTLTVSAANCHISGIKVISDAVDVAVGITATSSADGLEVDNCIIVDGGTTILELVIGISIATTCNEVNIHHNVFETFPAGSGTLSAIKFVGTSHSSIIVHNDANGDWNTAAFDFVTGASKDCIISDNTINNFDAAAGLAISCKSDMTGSCVRNLVHGGLNGTAAVACAGMNAHENYSTNAEGASGVIKPAIDT